MKTIQWLGALLLSGVALGGGAAQAAEAGGENQAQRQKMLDAVKQGNHKDAYDGFRKLALDPADDPRQVGGDLNQGTQCLQRLNRVNEMDDFARRSSPSTRTTGVSSGPPHRTSRRSSAKDSRSPAILKRGRRRGGGKVVNAQERDRIAPCN